MKKRNVGLKWVTVFLSAGLLAGCGNSGSTPADSGGASTKPTDDGKVKSKEPVTVEFWHAYGEGEEKVLKEKVIPKFEETHPNITIKATRMPTLSVRTWCSKLSAIPSCRRQLIASSRES